MAQHLEIGKAGFDLFFATINPNDFRSDLPYKKQALKVGGKYVGHIMLLGREYNENTGSLLGDEYVLSYIPKKGNETYEIHLNYRNQINKVYLVS